MGNALWNIVPFFWLFLLGLVVIPVVVAHIGIEHYGLYGIIAVLLTPLGLANLGFGEATIKYVAEQVHNGDLESAAQYVRTTLWMNLVVGLSGAVVFWMVAWWMVLQLFHVRQADAELVRQCCVLVGFGWIFNQVAGVFMGIPVAFQDFRRVALIQVIVATITGGLSILFVVSGLGLRGYTLANVLGSFAAMAGWYISSREHFGSIPLRPKLYRRIWRQCFHFGGWQTLAQLGSLLANQSEKFLLGIFLNPASLGLFNIALGLEQKAYQVVFKLSEVLFPMFSALSGEQPAEKAGRLMRVSWLLTALAVSVLIPLVPLATPLLSLWINATVAKEAAPILQLLSVAGALGCATNAAYFFLMGNGKTGAIALVTFLTGFTTVTAALILLPAFGLQAAAIPDIAAMLVQQIALGCYLLRRTFGQLLPVWRILTSLYLPIVVGLAFCMGVAWSGVMHRVDTWSWLVGGYILLVVISGGCILLGDVFWPDRQQHWDDIRRVAAWARFGIVNCSRGLLCVE
jgi:O-antigen/teichoic acid export membrane protein